MKRASEMTTHEYAKELLADIDCPLDWPICRACGKRMPPGSGISTGATQIGEGCYVFHASCRTNLTKDQEQEINLVSSKLFDSR